MAATKITGLTAIDAVVDADLVAVVDDVAGIPATKKAAWTDVWTWILGKLGFSPSNVGLRIVETSTGVWSGDAPSRSGGTNPIVFIGATDPADATNGIDTPANIASYDEWIDTSA